MAFFISLNANSQTHDVTLNTPLYEKVETSSVINGSRLFTKIRPYSTRAALNTSGSFNRTDSLTLGIYAKGLSTGLFTDRVNLFSVHEQGIDMQVNPVFHFGIGSDSRSTASNYMNSRGLEFRAMIDDKVAVYTLISENQALFPSYITGFRDSLGVIPGEGFWKLFGDQGTDFFRAEGYVDVGLTEHISAQMGFGRHFIGDGQRSLILSDFGNRYPYVKLETEVWRIKYTNLFAQLVGNAAFGSTGSLGNEQFPQKFMTMHHLDVSVTDKLNIGLFESVVFGEPDSLGGGIKLQYLNPVIFYRALEQQDGSPDNVIIGLDFNWDILNRITLYGQLVIDELVTKEVFSGEQWWGNKQGFQLGGKYYNAFGLKDFMIQGEFNAVRPYTYAHENFFTSYSHYNMPLAHPLGANFREVIGKVDFRPWDRWRFQGVAFFASYGDDTDGQNFGRNVLATYNSRPSEYGNAWLQGNRKNLAMMSARSSFEVRPNMFIDADFTLRQLTSEEQSTIFGLSFRWNMPDRFYLF